MLTSDEFVDLVASLLRRKLNPEQSKCVSAPHTQPLLIIAGPGTGKTTVMVLRALRHLLVDRVLPESIVITTFTKKAAQEVRTRWLDWGIPLIQAAKNHVSFSNPADQEWLDHIDLNHCVTGTLDSICEQLLGEYRPAGTVSPVVIEGYPANQRLLRSGLQNGYYANKRNVTDYLAKYTRNGDAPRTQADILQTSRTILDRFVHDQVDINAFRVSTPDTSAKETLALAQERYTCELAADSQLDFALLEQEFLCRVKQGLLDEAVMSWKALLVDEYQDTNPLQEEIYFELVNRSGSSLSVVGDDDQSLYRFRGATVELFTQFVSRLKTATALATHTEYLKRNYRSTPEIVTYFNNFISYDKGFSSARIQPPKPAIDPDRSSLSVPVLGMFRKDPSELAHDLAEFLDDVFRNGGFDVSLGAGQKVSIVGDDKEGDFGDAVFLSHSVNEYGRPFMGNPPKERLPLLLRRELDNRGVAVFNPRGQALSDQPSVQTLLGLVLECLDRSSAQASAGVLTPDVTGLTNVARDRMSEWRVRANDFINSAPAPGGLREFVDAWAQRKSRTMAWPDDWPLLELTFKLISWMPDFREDPEHQVWLEAISRSAAESRLFSPYGGLILNKSPHDERSRASIIRDILRPIAEGMVDLDEDLIPNVPRDRMSIMTIHQSKGLEFPLVIVDISSGYSRNHHKHAGARFPKEPSNVTQLEDDLAPFTSVGVSRTSRTALDRTFDDLVRLYYVAYSRAQTALLIVGHEKTIATASTVKTVASGWRRDGTWSWHDPHGTRSTFANHPPLVLI